MGPTAELSVAAPRGRGEFWIGLGVLLAVAVSNVPKPVHIDDTLYLNIARWIVRHPFDPYGGTLNWQHIPEPAWAVSISPPLLSYQFAALIALAGENIPLLHVAMLPWVVLAAWSLRGLGRRWGGAGGSLVSLVLLSPAVLAGMNLMLDVPLLACIVASVECLLRGVERPRRSASATAWWYLAAALSGAAGVLIKFPALALVPVFLVAAVTRRRWGPILVSAGPIGALLAWQALSRWLYGAGQLQAGLSFLSQFHTQFLRQIVERTLSMFAILGWTFPFWVLAPARLGRPGRVAAGATGVIAASAAAALLGSRWWQGPWLACGFVLGAGLGAFGFAACLWPPFDAPTHPGRDDPRPLCWAWILGVVAIVLPFAPFVAVRSFLPLQPPLALLLLSRRVPRQGATMLAVGLSTLLGVLLAAADFHWAACYPSTVRRLERDHGANGRPIVFLGHWGWQYYAERAGFQPWDARWREPPPGAVVVLPLRADRQWIHPDALRRLQFRSRIEVPPSPLRLTTWNRALGVRFYGGDFGELPWGISTEPAEEFFVSQPRPR